MPTLAKLYDQKKKRLDVSDLSSTLVITNSEILDFSSAASNKAN